MMPQLHKFIQDTIDNMKLTDYRIGTVEQINPVKIDFGDNKIITDVGTNILYTEQVIEKKIQLNHSHTLSNLSHSHTDTDSALSGDYISDEKLTTYTITEGIKQGDKLLMLRVASGQKWIVLSILRNSSKVEIDTNNNWEWS